MPTHVFSALALVLCLLGSSAAPAEDDRVVEIGYYAIKPSLVSNLQGNADYIRCDVQLMTQYASELSKVELHEPALRHALLMLLASQNGDRLVTRDGKESLRQTALAAVQQHLETLAGDPIISDLFFTNYYVK